jgi:translation initiation factor IF-3
LRSYGKEVVFISKDKRRRINVNERIRASSVRVIGLDGNQIGVMDIGQALEISREAGLDLVEVAPDADPPVCKIMDFGKYKYKQKKRSHQIRKKSHSTQTKELRLRPKTETHDFNVKLNHARRFLDEDYRVQVTMLFRGREMAHKDLGREKLERFAKELEDIAKIDQAPKMEGYRMGMILSKR